MMQRMFEEMALLGSSWYEPRANDRPMVDCQPKFFRIWTWTWVSFWLIIKLDYQLFSTTLKISSSALKQRQSHQNQLPRTRTESIYLSTGQFRMKIWCIRKISPFSSYRDFTQTEPNKSIRSWPESNVCGKWLQWKSIGLIEYTSVCIEWALLILLISSVLAKWCKVCVGKWFRQQCELHARPWRGLRQT